MHMLDTWEQTAVFNPADPTQKKIEKYAGIPGAYASFYFNRVPTTAGLRGPFTSSIATGAGVAVGVMLVSVAIGASAWALRRAGVLKRKPGVSGLGWGRRRRRRKR